LVSVVKTQGVFLLILLAATCFAQIEIDTIPTRQSFDLSVPATQVDICDCGTADASFFIRNTGNTISWFQISTDDRYSTVYPGGLYLGPGEITKVTDVVNIPCGTADYQSNVFVRSGAETWTVSFSIDVEKCNNLYVVPLVTYAQSGPCEDSELAVELFNTGSFTETYHISEGGNETIVSLRANSSIPIRIHKTPDCGFSGESWSTLVVRTELTKLRVEIPLLLNITPDYGFTLETPQEVLVCEGFWSSIHVNLTNHGIRNEFTLDDGSKVILGKGETKEIILRHRPDGNDITMGVRQAYGGGLEQKPIQVKSRECVKASVQAMDTCDDTPVTIEVENSGVLDAAFDLSFSIGGSAGNASMKLEVGETGEIVLTNVEAGQHTFFLNYSAMNVSGTTTADIRIMDAAECDKPVLQTRQIWVPRGEAQRGLALKNAGYRAVNYTFTQDELPWLEILNKTLELEANATGYIEVQATAGNETGEYDYPIELVIGSESEVFREKLTVTVSEMTWQEWLSRNRCMIALTIEFLIVIALAAAFILKKNRDLAIFALLALIFLLINFGFCFRNIAALSGLEKSSIDTEWNSCPYELLICSSPMYINWSERTMHTVDLGRFFDDPDNDSLSYSSDGNENISISFSGAKAVLDPGRWKGIEKVVFRATDTNNLSAGSPDFYLHVLEAKEIGLNDVILSSYWLIIILLVLATIYVAVRLNRK